MRIPTVTVDRGGQPVVINARDFRRGIDRLWGEEAPPPAPEAPASRSTEQDELIVALAQLGIKRNRRTSVETLRKLLQEAQAAS